MAINLTEAEAALKSYYLDIVAEQLDHSDPFLAAVKKSAADVVGKDVRRLAIYGVNGGIGAGTETGDLPASSGNSYKQLTATLKNLYGTIEITDKAVRASANGAGAFVNLLTAEMEGLVKASSYNLGRMMFGDGSGTIAKVVDITSGAIALDSVHMLTEGMMIDFLNAGGAAIAGATSRRIMLVDRINKTIRVSGTMLTTGTVPADSLVAVQGSHNNEITGLKAIFDTTKNLYGLQRAANPWLNPYIRSLENAEISELDIQTALDEIEEASGGRANMIICSWGVRRALQKLFAESIRNVDTVELKGGYRAISYNGIPIVADRFCDKGSMYLLNTDDFTMHQLCDWQWLEGEDGSVLRQIPGKPVYTATLVKYAELMCDRPCAQGLIKDIKEA